MLAVLTAPPLQLQDELIVLDFEDGSGLGSYISR